MLAMNAPMYDVRPGQLVLVRLDPLASVAALEDEVAAQAAARLHRTTETYLALVASIDDRFVFTHDDSIAFSVELLLIGNERPVDYPATAIPVNLSSSTSPLFIHTTCAVSAFISCVADDLRWDAPYPVLSRGELAAVISKAREDQLQSPAWIVHEDETASPLASSIFSGCEPPVAQGSPATSPASPLSWFGDGYGASPFDAKLAAIARSSLDAAALEVTQRLQKNLEPVVFVRLNTDLNASRSPLSVPVTIRAAHAQLKEIWRNWQERLIVELSAKRSQTELWVKSVTVSDPGAWEDGAHIEYDILDDVAVLPEDAIDERHEALAQCGTPGAEVVETGYIPMLLPPPACLREGASDVSERTCLPSDYHQSTDNHSEDVRANSASRHVGGSGARTPLLDIRAGAGRTSFLRKVVDGGAALLRALRLLCARGLFIGLKCSSREDISAGRPRKMSKESRAVKMGGRLVRIRSCVL